MSTTLSSSWTPASPTRKGGILLKPTTIHAVSYDDSTSHTRPSASTTSETRSNRSYSSSSDDRPPQPVTPSNLHVPHIPLTESISAGGIPESRKGPKIKFAPLPDPRAAGGRRLSTGADLKFAASLGPGGERTMEMQRAGRGGDVVGGAEGGTDRNESALADDDDDDPANNDEHSVDQQDEASKRRGSVLSGSWRGTKKLLTLGLSSSASSKQLNRTTSLESNGSGGSSDGGALSRTFSNISRSLNSSSNTPASPSARRASSVISNSSTHTETSAERQSRILASLAPTKDASTERTSSPSSRNHRNSLSVDAASLSTSPRSPVGMRMINGRVYGSKGMDTIKKAEQEALKGPDFKEWGQQGLGSNSRTAAEEEEDGSGMGWVKRRREAKEKKEKEEREAAEAAAAAALRDPTLSDDNTLDSLLSPDTPPLPSTPAPNTRSSPLQTVNNFPPRLNLSPPSRKSTADGIESGQITPRTEAAHRLESVTIPGHQHPSRSGSTTPTNDRLAAFSLTPLATSGGGGSANSSVKPLAIGTKSSSVGPWLEDGKGSSLEDSDSEEEEEEEEEDGDREEDEDDEDSDDSEEERLTEEARKTAVSAGIEVLSRHKSHDSNEG